MSIRRFSVWALALMPASVLALVATSIASAEATRSLVARAAGFPPVRTVVADYDQEREVSLVADVLRAHGTLALRAPDSMRLDIESPDRLTLLAEGARVAIVDAEGVSRALPPELSGLAGFARQLTDLLLAGKTGDRFSEAWQGDTATLTARDTTSPFAEIALRFVPGGPLPVEIVLRERGGDRTTIRLANVRLNPTLEAGRFELPPGATP